MKGIRQETVLPSKMDVVKKRRCMSIDATGKVLGRLSCDIAIFLMGKLKRDYVSFFDCGDFVDVFNVDKIFLSGNKLSQKSFFYHTGYPGGDRKIPYSVLMKKNPKKVLEISVKRMLPKNRLAKRQILRLNSYLSSENKTE